MGEQILVPVELRGQGLRMVLGLGNTWSVVRPSAVQELRLPTERYGLGVKMDRRTVTAIATVGTVSIGEYQLPRRDFFVDPRAHTIEDPPGGIVLGTLGMSELWPVDFELDLAHRRFNLYSPEHCAGAAARSLDYGSRIPIELSEFGNMSFPVEINGLKIVAGISTTSRDTYMTSDVAREMFGFGEHSSGVQEERDPTGRPQEYFRTLTITSGDLTFSNLSVRLAPPITMCTLSKTGVFGEVAEYKARGDHLCYGTYPVVLGTRALEHWRLYFAAHEKVIYFTTAEPGQ